MKQPSKPKLFHPGAPLDIVKDPVKPATSSSRHTDLDDSQAPADRTSFVAQEKPFVRHVQGPQGNVEEADSRSVNSIVNLQAPQAPFAGPYPATDQDQKPSVGDAPHFGYLPPAAPSQKPEVPKPSLALPPAPPAPASVVKREDLPYEPMDYLSDNSDPGCPLPTPHPGATAPFPPTGLPTRPTPYIASPSQAPMPSVQEQSHQDSLSIGSYSSKEDIRKRHFLNNFVRPQNPAVPQATCHDSVTSPSPPMKDLFAESDFDEASNPHDYFGPQDDGDPSFSDSSSLSFSTESSSRKKRRSKRKTRKSKRCSA